MMNVTMGDILAARKRLAPYLSPTPIERAPVLGEEIYFKLENLNTTRSFKVRGALNAMLNLSDADKGRGIVACSAGNHAQGVAYAADLLGIAAQVVMPTHTPKRKVKGAKKYGAEITLYGENYDVAEAHARKLEAQMGMTFISPYNDRLVIAGQGTVGLELFEELPRLQRVIVPTSGGGLLGGIALICKTLNPECEVIGVQSVATPAMHNFFYGQNLPQGETLAEGLSGDIETGSITLDLCRRYTDQIVLVTESQIAEAVRWMLIHHNWVIEGAAATAIAAILSEAVPRDGKQCALIISGGNIDYETLKHVMAE